MLTNSVEHSVRKQLNLNKKIGCLPVLMQTVCLGPLVSGIPVLLVLHLHIWTRKPPISYMVAVAA